MNDIDLQFKLIDVINAEGEKRGYEHIGAFWGQRLRDTLSRGYDQVESFMYYHYGLSFGDYCEKVLEALKKEQLHLMEGAFDRGILWTNYSNEVSVKGYIKKVKRCELLNKST